MSAEYEERVRVPTYQYACTQCDERLEAVQTFTDAPLTECPVCGGRLRKVFSAVGVVFKGSGFYKTDSRSNGSGKASGDGGSKDGPKETAAKDGGSKDGGSKEKATAGAGGDSGASGGSSGKKDGGAKAPASGTSTPAAKSA